MPAPQLADGTDTNRHAHEGDEGEIGESGKADEIDLPLGKEPLCVSQRLGCLAAETPPALRLSDHQCADPDTDQPGGEEDQADQDGELAFHAVLLWQHSEAVNSGGGAEPVFLNDPHNPNSLAISASLK